MTTKQNAEEGRGDSKVTIHPRWKNIHTEGQNKKVKGRKVRLTGNKAALKHAEKAAGSPKPVSPTPYHQTDRKKKPLPHWRTQGCEFIHRTGMREQLRKKESQTDGGELVKPVYDPRKLERRYQGCGTSRRAKQTVRIPLTRRKCPPGERPRS